MHRWRNPGGSNTQHIANWQSENLNIFFVDRYFWFSSFLHGRKHENCSPSFLKSISFTELFLHWWSNCVSTGLAVQNGFISKATDVTGVRIFGTEYLKKCLSWTSIHNVLSRHCATFIPKVKMCSGHCIFFSPDNSLKNYC